MLRALSLCLAVTAAACGRETPSKPQPGAGDTLRALSSVERLIDAGKADEALRAAESLRKAAPRDAMVAEMLGRARLAARRPAAEVADAYLAAAELAPDSPGLQGAAGMMAAQASRATEALACLARAESLEPGNPQHALLQARLLLDQARVAEALAAAERARAIAPLDATVLLCVARCRLANHDTEGCLEPARSVLRSQAAPDALRAESAALLSSAGHASEAAEALRPLARSMDATQALLETLAQCQSAAGRPREAADTWQRVAAMPSQPWNPCLRAAECLLSAGDLAGARDWIARARERRAPPGEVERLEAALRAAAPVSGSSGPRPRE